MSIGERIKELRTTRDMSQARFADFLGVSKSAVSLWESDRRTPPTKSLDLIAKKCNVSVSWLMYDDDEQYYLNDKTREYAEILYGRPEIRVLLDCAKDADKNDILAVARLLERCNDASKEI